MTSDQPRYGYAPYAKHLVPAPVRRRLAARVIDAGVVALCAIPVLAVALFALSARGYGSESEMDATASTALISALAVLALGYAAYEYRSMRRSGQTLGKRLTGIRVLTVSGDPLDARAARNRVLVLAAVNLGSFALALVNTSLVTSVLAPLALVLVFEAALLWRTDGRHLADRAAATIVVTENPERPARAFRLRRVVAAVFVLATIAQGFAEIYGDDGAELFSTIEDSRETQFMQDIVTIYGAADALAGVDGVDLSRANFDRYLDEAVEKLEIDDSFYLFDTDTNAFSWQADIDTTYLRYLCFTGPLDTECPTTLDA